MKVSSHLFSLSLSLVPIKNSSKDSSQKSTICLSHSYFIFLLLTDIITCNFIETTTKISLLTFFEPYIFSSRSIVEVQKLSNLLSPCAFYAPKSIFFCPFKFIVCCEFSCPFCNFHLICVSKFSNPRKTPRAEH